MKVSFGQMVQDLKRRSQRRRMSLTVILVLSLFVSTGIVWKLRSVGITMVNDAECGIEEHVHNEMCYEHKFICGVEETSDSEDTIDDDDENNRNNENNVNNENAGNRHVHDVNCFTEEFVCDKVEHTHTLECFGDESLVEKLKDKKNNEIQVVEIPGAEIVEYSEDEMSEILSEGEDFYDDIDPEQLEDELEEGYLTEEEYNSILSKLLGNKDIGMLREMDVVNSLDEGTIYRRNSSGQPETLTNPVYIAKGQSASFLVWGSGVNNKNNKGEISYFYHTNSKGDYVQTPWNGYPFNKGDTKFENNHAYVTVSANNSGTAGIGYGYVKTDASKPVHTSQIIHVYEMNKIFLVKDNGQEVEVNGTLYVNPGDKLTFCVYTDYNLTYRAGDNVYADDANTIYANNSLSSSSSNSVWFNKEGNTVAVNDVPKPSTNPSDEVRNNLIRRYEKTYTFNNVNDYTIMFRELTSIKVNVYEKNKIFLVSDDGHESEVNQTLYVNPGDKLRFCVYTDYNLTYQGDNNTYNDEPNTIYADNNLAADSWSEVWFDNEGNIVATDSVPKPSTNPSDEVRNNLIRRYERTYTFKDEINYTITFRTLNRINVNVQKFDFNRLYHIYWIDDNGNEVLNTIPKVSTGGNLTFCIYTDYTNTYSNTEKTKEHTLYVNEGSKNGISSSNASSYYFSDKRADSPQGSQIRRYELTFTFKKTGDFDILYSAVTPHKVHVFPDINNSNDIVLLKTDSTYMEISKNSIYNNTVFYDNDENRYPMEYGDKIELIGYTKNSNLQFKNSYNGDQSNPNVNCDNQTDSYNGITVVRCYVDALNTGKSEIEFGNTKFYVDVNEHIFNDIYVVTRLGERLKDRVHERGVTYEPNSNSENNRYILYVDEEEGLGESVQICIYTDKNNEHWFYSDKAKPQKNEDSNKEYFISLTNEVKSDTNDSYRKVNAMIKAERPGTCNVVFDKGNGVYANFYVEVRSNKSADNTYIKEFKDHADIEIDDGGYYEVSREVYSKDNTVKTVYYERYDTVITGVNSCEILGIQSDNDSSNDVSYDDISYDILHKFVSTDYYQSGKLGEQQYELNSKRINNGRQLYDRFKVRKVLFDVSVTMIPTIQKKDIYTLDNNKKWILDSTENITDNDLKVINSITFDFGEQGIVDALNKCSDHSGMDFNVTKRLNEVVAQISFEAEKTFTDESGNVLDTNDFSNHFSFDLKNDTTNETKTAKNANDGRIVFEDVFVQKEVNYNYTLKENLNGSQNNYITLNLNDTEKIVKLDSEEHKIYVKVYKEGGVLKTKYYKDNGHTNIYDESVTFENKVYDANTSLVVKKVWSDGNDKHSGQSISFVVYQKIDGNTEKQAEIGGKSEFSIDSNSRCDGQNWTVKLDKLPLRDTQHTYTYRVEEKNVPENYSASYEWTQNGKECIINNLLSSEISLSIKKEWYDMDGNSYDGPANRTISYKIDRYVRAETNPVKIQIRNNQNREQLLKEQIVDVEFSYYKTLEFSISGGSIKEVDYLNCKKEWDDENIIKAGIENQKGAVITVYVEPSTNQPVQSGGPVIWDFENNNKGEWSAVNQANVSVSTEEHRTGQYSLMSTNRSDYWDGPKIDLRGKVSPGKEYIFTAYAKFINTQNDGFVHPKITIMYGNEFKNDWNDQKSAQVAIGSDWTLLSGKFKIPDNIDDISMKIETSENDPMVDIYIDDVSIVPDGWVEPDEPADNSQDENPIKITVNSGSVNNKWIFDCTVFDNQTLSSNENWMRTYTEDAIKTALASHKDQNGNARNLTDPGKEYIYLVEEVRPVGYKEPEYSGYTYNIGKAYGVSRNTPDNPIIIKNQQLMAYSLPPTGGEGTEKYIISGAVLILISSALLIYRRRCRRRSDT